MLRTVLMVLALLVLLVVGLVYLGIFNLQSTPEGGVKATMNPVQVGVEHRNVTLPVPTVGPAQQGNAAQPAPQPLPQTVPQAAPQPAPQQTPPAQPAPAP